MPQIHRIGDFRRCGATTVGVDTKVWVEGKPVALEGMINSHGGAPLKAVFGAGNVYVNNIKVITVSDTAAGRDKKKHNSFLAGPGTGSSTVQVYGGASGAGTGDP